MSVLVTSLALGSLYCLIAVVLVLHFKVSGFLNIGVLGYIALAPYLVASFTSEHSSIFIFLAVCLGIMFFISLLSFVIDFGLFKPISRLSSAMKVIVSISVLFITLTFIDIIWPSGANLETPVGTKSISIFSIDLLLIDAITLFVAFIVVFGLFFILSKTIMGNRLLAFAQDQQTARAYGVSLLYVKLLISVFTGVMASLAGILLASPGSPRVGVTSVIFYSLIALSPVIIARHSDLLICFISSFLVAFVQIFSSANINSINEGFHGIVSNFGLSTAITLGPTFADRFVPFAIALLALIIIPSRWIRDDANG